MLAFGEYSKIGTVEHLKDSMSSNVCYQHKGSSKNVCNILIAYFYTDKTQA